ncbi:MAG: hypothetical protein DRP46_10625 [Candidatus Zixiibacteriota bacterium]|nr:MAG: hypothetical protein DRP46_10625 [candidate division Zixibacteria bacterium]
MPKFDHPADRDLWLSQSHPLLEAVINMLDALFFIFHKIYGAKLFPYRKVEVAHGGFIRPKGKRPSFHPLGQALDVRTKDMGRRQKKLILSVLAFLRKLANSPIEHVYEPAKFDDEGNCVRGEHIHIEIDTKKDGVFPV